MPNSSTIPVLNVGARVVYHDGDGAARPGKVIEAISDDVRGPVYNIEFDTGAGRGNVPGRKVELDLDQVDADLHESSASGLVDGPDATYNWAALQAMRTAENLRAEVERLRAGIKSTAEDLEADALRHQYLAAGNSNDFWGIRSKVNTQLSAAYSVAASKLRKGAHVYPPGGRVAS